MQVTHKYSKRAQASEKSWYLILKGIVFMVLLVYTVMVVREKKVFETLFVQARTLINTENMWALIVPVLLLPANWAVEAWKWQFLVDKFEKISFLKSYRCILSGVAFGFATPHGLGDYFGRIMQLSVPDRDRLVGAVFLSRIGQFYITLFAGVFSLMVYLLILEVPDELSRYAWVIISICAITALLPLCFYKSALGLLLKKFNKGYVKRYVEPLIAYDRGQLVKILLMSAVRYLIFTAQFILLLYLFGVSTDVMRLFLGVNLIFFAKSVIPTFFELGVREYAALYFFGKFGFLELGVLSASLSLWLINIVLPAIAGMFLIFKLKLKLKH